MQLARRIDTGRGAQLGGGFDSDDDDDDDDDDGGGGGKKKKKKKAKKKAKTKGGKGSGSGVESKGVDGAGDGSGSGANGILHMTYFAPYYVSNKSGLPLTIVGVGANRKEKKLKKADFVQSSEDAVHALPADNAFSNDWVQNSNSPPFLVDAPEGKIGLWWLSMLIGLLLVGPLWPLYLQREHTTRVVWCCVWCDTDSLSILLSFSPSLPSLFLSLLPLSPPINDFLTKVWWLSVFPSPTRNTHNAASLHR